MKSLLMALAVFLVPLHAAALTFEYTEGPLGLGSILVQTIRDLEINGQFYDVSFDRAFGNDVFSGDAGAAFEATDVIRFALFIEGAQLGVEVFVANQSDNGKFFVAFNATEAWSTFRSSGWIEPIVNNPFNYDPAAATGFTAVPEPSVALLMGLGLAWLAGRGSTRRQE